MGHRGRAALVVSAVLMAALSAAVLYVYARPPAVHRVVLTRHTAPLDNQNHLYVLDGWGGVHPVGASPDLTVTAVWPTRDIAYSLALFADGTGGYVLDGWGQLHAVGAAYAIDSGVYWPHWIGAREVVLAPWATRSNPEGYILDADGGIHPFAGAPAVTGNAVWNGQGIARALVLAADSTPAAVKGYTLDGYGGVHSFGGAPDITDAAAWPGQDVARGLVLEPGRPGAPAQGYTLDYSGGVHPFGGAPAVEVSASWPGQDVADSIVAWTGARDASPGGWVLDRHGGVHEYGSAPQLAASQTWPSWDIARGLAGAGSAGGSTENAVLEPEPISDTWGAYYNQRDARWADHKVGAADVNVWKIGCLLTDLAMVYAHFGFKSVTPGSVAAHGGWFTLGGAIYNSALNIPGHATLINNKPDPSWISAHLRSGHPVIVGLTLYGGGTHFVTLTGMNGDSDYWVDDPWEQNAMHVPFSGDWSDRGPIFEAIAFV